MALGTELAVSMTSEEPAWKQRAFERSTKAAKIRAERKLSRFLDAARAIIAEKGTTDFTVQEIVDRSRQSLRSFYQHFGSKHELLLALFEDALSRSAEEVREAAATEADPMEQIRIAIQLLFEQSQAGPTQKRPLFTDFAPQLLISHPAEVKDAHAPLLAVFTEIVARAQAVGEIRADIRARRMASIVMQTVMFLAQSNGVPEDASAHPITADEVWAFCSTGFTRPS
jgi:AcrR family transcriptional regulator